MQKTVNIFMRKQRTILINAEKRFFECSKQIRICSIRDMQRANFINVETNFIKCSKIDSIIVKFKHEKAFKFGF